MWAQMTHKKRKMSRHVLFWVAGCSLLRDRGFSCSLDILCGSIGINILHFWSKNENCFSSVILKKIASYCISIMWILILIYIDLKCCYLDPGPPRQIFNNENKLDLQQLYFLNMDQFFKVTGAGWVYLCVWLRWFSLICWLLAFVSTFWKIMWIYDNFRCWVWDMW